MLGNRLFIIRNSATACLQSAPPGPLAHNTIIVLYVHTSDFLIIYLFNHIIILNYMIKAAFTITF